MPTSRKGACARHVTDVNRFFKVRRSIATYAKKILIYVLQGIHVTINARHEDDLDESIVLEKVSKASGLCYYLKYNNITTSTVCTLVLGFVFLYQQSIFVYCRCQLQLSQGESQSYSRARESGKYTLCL